MRTVPAPSSTATARSAPWRPRRWRSRRPAHGCPADGVRYPSGWHMRVPALDLDLNRAAGAGRPGAAHPPALLGGRGCGAGHARRGGAAAGRGYVELVGYAQERCPARGHWRAWLRCPMMAPRSGHLKHHDTGEDHAALTRCGCHHCPHCTAGVRGAAQRRQGPGLHHRRGAGRQGLQVQPRRCAQAGPGGAVLLPEGVHLRVHRRGARLRRGDRASSRRSAPRSSASRTTRSTRSPSSRPRNAATSSRSARMPTAAS